MSQDVYVGKDRGVQTCVVSPELIRQYIEGIGDPHPWDTGESPFGGSIAPALIFSSLFSGDQVDGTPTFVGTASALP